MIRPKRTIHPKWCLHPLVVFRQGRQPEEIPLEQITHVQDFLMPNGMIGVNVFTSRPADVPDPGMSFRSPKVLASFVETLRERIQRPAEEVHPGDRVRLVDGRRGVVVAVERKPYAGGGGEEFVALIVYPNQGEGPILVSAHLARPLESWRP